MHPNNGVATLYLLLIRSEFQLQGHDSEISADRFRDASPRARWLAQDADGTWWAYEHEPNEGTTSWYENEVGDSIRLCNDVPNSDWRETLMRIR